jgi:HEAT repeat protein
MKSALFVMVTAACSGRAPAAEPASDPAAAPSGRPVAGAASVRCPAPGPLAATIASLSGPAAPPDPLGQLNGAAKPRVIALALADTLDCADRELRVAVLKVVQRGGATLADALPAVARWIGHPDRYISMAALAAFESLALGEDRPAGDATRLLLVPLAQTNRVDRLPLLRVLADIHPTLDAYPWFAEALRDADVSFRQTAVEGIAAMLDEPPATLPDSLLTTLIAATADPDERVRSYATYALGKTRDPRAVAVLSAAFDRAVQAYRAEDGSYVHAVPDDARIVLAGAIGQAAGAAHHLQGKLSQLLRSTVPMEVLAAAAYALGSIGADAPDAIAELADAYTMPYEGLIESMPSDGREELRAAAHSALQRLGARNPTAVSRALLATRRDRDAAALQLACELHASPIAVAPVLVSALRNREGYYLIDACLGTKRSLASAAIPSLIAHARSTDVGLFPSAAYALGSLGSRAGVPVLITVLARTHRERPSNDRESTAITVLNALARIGPGARVRDALVPWLSDEVVGPTAAVALIATGTDAELGVKQLAAALASPQSVLRYRAALELGKVITDERVAALRAPLAALMGDDRAGNAAIAAICKLGPAAAPFLPLLRDRMRVAHRISPVLAEALLQIGPAAAAAFPELVAALENDVPPRREEALPVLAMIMRETPGGDARLRAALADDPPQVRRLGERAIALAQAP